MIALVLALLKSGDGTSKKGSAHPFRKRFHAWWEGYELPDAPDDAAGGPGAGPLGDAEGGEDAAPEIPEADPNVWSEERMKVVQMLWGSGFSKPGDLEYVLDLAKPFGLTKENTMLELGAGLGGSSRGVVEKFGAYVDGFELNEALVTKANELSKVEDMEKKVVIKPLDLQSFELKHRYYDGCLIRELLMDIEDKGAMLNVVVDSLKTGKALVVSDFFSPEPEPGEHLLKAMEAEKRPLFPCTVDEIVELLEERSCEIRVNNDETERHEDVIRAAWGEIADLMQRKEVDETLSKALMLEMDKWDFRNAAYEAGELRLQRIVAFKTGDVS